MTRQNSTFTQKIAAVSLSRRTFAGIAGCAALAAFAGTALADGADKGQGGQGGQGGSQAQASVTGEPQPVRYDDEGNRIVTDSYGTEVTCPANMERIMTFGSVGVINTLVETLGCGWMIANEMSPRFANGGWEYQYKFAPQLSEGPQLENAEGELDIEGIMAADPQLCIVMQSATADTLRQNGINTLCLGFGNGRDETSIKNAMIILGDALDAADKAAEYNTYLDDMVKKIADVVAAVPEDERVKVLYGNVAQLTNPHILSEWFIPAAGGISVTADIHDKPQCTYTVEDLLAWDPDVIIMIQDNAEELKADDQINGVAAIVNDRLYTLPTVGHFITGSTEIAYGILYVANLLYPELYPVDELRDDMYYFYDTFFGYQMSDEELDELIYR